MQRWTPARKALAFCTYQRMCERLERAPTATELAEVLSTSRGEINRAVYPWLRRCDGLIYPPRVRHEYLYAHQRSQPEPTDPVPVDQYLGDDDNA